MCCNNGRIEIIMGSMFSGKSTEIIRIINRYSVLDKSILIINSAKDNRYGENSIITHNKQKKKCLSMNRLTTCRDSNDYINADIIIIEEAQFFEDLFDFVTYAADNDHKTIILAGLNGDFNREPFGDILRLIPHAEKVTKLSALCLICNDGTLAHFSKRIVDNKEQTLVGSNDNYIAVCRKHYNED